MNILYWNIDKNELSFTIYKLCIERNIDILILSEHERLDIDLLLSKFRSANYIMREEFIDIKKKSIVFCKENIDCHIYYDGARYCIHKLKFDIGTELLLVSVHLASKNHIDDIRQIGPTSRIKAQIESIEQSESNNNTLIVGDFNMNPYDRGMIDFYGFNSTMSLTEAKRAYRVVDGEKISYFYNPMWHYMGNNECSSLGTYYYRNSNVSIDWNTFDQILVRPKLLEEFDIDNICFVTEINGERLISDTGIPKKKQYSDHLPLYFELREV